MHLSPNWANIGMHYKARYFLKVSKFRKQIDFFSFEPKTERNISALRIDPKGRNISFGFWFKWEQDNLLSKFTDL